MPRVQREPYLVFLIGPPQSGKTTLLEYALSRECRPYYQPTVDCDDTNVHVESDGEPWCDLRIIEVGASDKYGMKLPSPVTHRADALVVVFDQTPGSCERATVMYKDFKSVCRKPMPTVFVDNKREGVLSVRYKEFATGDQVLMVETRLNDPQHISHANVCKLFGFIALRLMKDRELLSDNLQLRPGLMASIPTSSESSMASRTRESLSESVQSAADSQVDNEPPHLPIRWSHGSGANSESSESLDNDEYHI